MGARRARVEGAGVEAIEAEMEALRAEMARLKRRESEAAARLSERRRAEETALLCFLGRTLLDDLDPKKLPLPGDALHYAARRGLTQRSAWYVLRLRAAALDPARRPPALEALLARLDGQAAQDREAAPIASLAHRLEGDRPTFAAPASQQGSTGVTG